jgi:hypothetical protein
MKAHNLAWIAAFGSCLPVAVAGALGGCGESDDSGTGNVRSGGAGGTSGQTGDAGGAGGGGGSAGSASGAGGTSGSGGTGGAGIDSGDCDALRRALEAKHEEVAQCYAGAPNPSSCEIVKDGLCDCAAVQFGYSAQYLQAAEAFKNAGCRLACPGVVCPGRAVCQPTSSGSTQGRCVPFS